MSNAAKYQTSVEQIAVNEKIVQDLYSAIKYIDPLLEDLDKRELPKRRRARKAAAQKLDQERQELTEKKQLIQQIIAQKQEETAKLKEKALALKSDSTQQSKRLERDIEQEEKELENIQSDWIRNKLKPSHLEPMQKLHEHVQEDLEDMELVDKNMKTVSALDIKQFATRMQSINGTLSRLLPIINRYTLDSIGNVDELANCYQRALKRYEDLMARQKMKEAQRKAARGLIKDIGLTLVTLVPGYNALLVGPATKLAQQMTQRQPQLLAVGKVLSGLSKDEVHGKHGEALVGAVTGMGKAISTYKTTAIPPAPPPPAPGALQLLNGMTEARAALYKKLSVPFIVVQLNCKLLDRLETQMLEISNQYNAMVNSTAQITQTRGVTEQEVNEKIDAFELTYGEQFLTLTNWATLLLKDVEDTTTQHKPKAIKANDVEEAFFRSFVLAWASQLVSIKKVPIMVSPHPMLETHYADVDSGKVELVKSYNIDLSDEMKKILNDLGAPSMKNITDDILFTGNDQEAVEKVANWAQKEYKAIKAASPWKTALGL